MNIRSPPAFVPRYDKNPHPGDTDFPIEVKDLMDIIKMY